MRHGVYQERNVIMAAKYLVIAQELERQLLARNAGK